jgi:hypothetical protein
VGDQLHARAALPRERDPVPIVQGAGWIPGPVGIGAENLAPTGIRSPDRQARSDYAIPAHKIWKDAFKLFALSLLFLKIFTN